MDTPNLLERMQRFYADEGTPLPGWDRGEEEAIAVATARYPGHPYCTVRQWSVLSIRVTEQELMKVQAMGFEPRVVIASNVITDSACRFGRGSPVHTTMQRTYDSDGFFVTRNTTYVLLGEGRMKDIDLGLYNFMLMKARAGL